jgi:purine-binding chemotaxis protein CheW
MEIQLVIFELGNEYFGVEIANVEGIIKMQELTRVPQAPGFVEGVTNLRGSVLPVVNLRMRFGMPTQTASRETRIVVIIIDGMKVGMVVDSVSEVLTIEDKIIEPTPPMVTTLDSTFIIGIVKLTNRLVILLDLEKVLTSAEKTKLQALPASV